MKLGAKPRASHRRDGSCDRSARVRRCSVGDGRKHLRLRAHDRSRPTRLVRRPPISRTPVPPRTVPPETRSRPSRHALLLHRRRRPQAHVNSRTVNSALVSREITTARRSRTESGAKRVGSCACASRPSPVVRQQPAGRHRRGRSCQETWTRSLLGPRPRASSASLLSSWEAVLVPQRI